MSDSLRIAQSNDGREHETTLLFTGTREVEKTREDGSTYTETEEVEFTIENRARPNLGYGFMRRLRTQGAEMANAWMMDKVLGDDALAYLEEQDDLTNEQNDALQERISKIVLGGAQPPKA